MSTLTKRIIIVGMLLLTAFALGMRVEDKVLAQSAPIQIQSSVAHASCTAATGVTTYCFANDGLYVSLAGATFTPIGGGGVTSVNGKTGAVTISASTTLQ